MFHAADGPCAEERSSGVLELRTGLNAPDDFLEQVFELDKQTYSPALCGVIENLYRRYDRCRDTFLLVYDGKELAGYICFLPVGESLYAQLNDPADRSMRDDDITPEEMADWTVGAMNHLFILSIVVKPAYRDGAAIRLLGDGLLDFLRRKEEAGCTIGSIAGSAVSDGGANFLRRLRCVFVKELDEGYRYYAADREKIEELLAYGLLLKDV